MRHFAWVLLALAAFVFVPAAALADDYKHGRYGYGHWDKKHQKYKSSHRYNKNYYGYDRRHYRRDYRHRSHGRHYNHKSGLDGGDALAIAAGVVVGAVVLDAIIDERKDRNPGYVAHPKVYSSGAVYPAPPPRAAPRRSYGASSYDGAVDLCADEADRLLSRQGAASSYVRDVGLVDRLDDGAWRVELNVIAEYRNAASVKPVSCVAGRDGLESLQIG